MERLSGISFSILKKKNDGHLELEITKDAAFAANIRFLEILSTIKHDDLTDFDFKVLPERPLHKVSDNKLRIISELLQLKESSRVFI